MTDGVFRNARFSEDRAYRYTLTRLWDPIGDGVVAFIGLNPSTADETEDDPTVRRCVRFARDWGFGGVVMLNAFAFRATDPTVMKAHSEPVGPSNDIWIAAWAMTAQRVVACWGVHGSHLGRAEEVRSLVRSTGKGLMTFGLTKAGQPKHPLYLPAAQRPEVWV